MRKCLNTYLFIPNLPFTNFKVIFFPLMIEHCLKPLVSSLVYPEILTKQDSFPSNQEMERYVVPVSIPFCCITSFYVDD